MKDSLTRVACTDSDDATGRSGQADFQRGRILDAAEKCFAERGFHAANMNGIAAAAGISPALIYRYFDNKQAIVLAIVARQLATNRAGLAQMQASSDLVRELTTAFALWSRADPRLWSAALFAEITAEGTRNPRIAEALQQSDRAGREGIADWLREREDRQPASEAAGDDVELRALLLQCLAEGLVIRAARQPDLDPALLEAMLRRVLPVVLTSADPGTWTDPSLSHEASGPVPDMPATRN